MSNLEIFSLKGKTILLTGATGYLGSAISWALARAGANVLINSRNQKRVQDLVMAINADGLLAESAVFDITDEVTVSEFFKKRAGLPLHCLINNAYAGSGGTIETASDEDYHRSFEIAVVCSSRVLRHALSGLRLAVRACKDASIINIASMYGSVSPDLRLYSSIEDSNPPFYGAAKASLIQWSKYAACQFGPEGIRVNTISPGPFPSKEVQEFNPEFVAKLANKVPMRRVGQANELQGVTVFLASSASSFVNGINLHVDGGWTSW